MPNPVPRSVAATHLKTTDLRSASRLVVEATLGLTRLIENLHHNIARAPGPLGETSSQSTSGVTGLVYRSIRGVTRLVGGSLDALLGQVDQLLGPGAGGATPEREAVLSALNGVLGDHLAETHNPLAIAMHLRHAGQAVPMERAALTAAIPQPGGDVLLLVHGLCMNSGQWRRGGHDHGAALVNAMMANQPPITPLYLHYNSGRHVSTNGLLLADQLSALQRAWPVSLRRIVIIGHSMGGLVARSACQQARERGDAWLQALQALVFLGTPHHGAPLERGGQWVDTLLGASPYTAAFARLGQLRSAGITDLRHGSLLDSDWQGQNRFAHRRDVRTPVPLPQGVDCYAIAGSLGTEAGELREALLGDGLVPVDSALGRHKQAARNLNFAPHQQWTAQGVNHLDLLSNADVFERLRAWLLVPRHAAT